MPIVEGRHAQQPSGRVVGYRAEYEVEARTIRFRAEFDGGRVRREGQFDFDPSKVAAAAAVDAFLTNQIAKGDWDAAP